MSFIITKASKKTLFIGLTTNFQGGFHRTVCPLVFKHPVVFDVNFKNCKRVSMEFQVKYKKRFFVKYSKYEFSLYLYVIPLTTIDQTISLSYLFVYCDCIFPVTD